MNGDEIRATRFLRPHELSDGYDASQVDGLLRHVAAELDAGRSAGPVIGTAALRKRYRRRSGYDIDAVDWFLDQILLDPDRAERAGLRADPWRDLPVAQCTRGEPGGAAPAWRRGGYFAEECAAAWRDFGQQPGTYLRYLVLTPFSTELRTAGQQTIASFDRGVISVGGRTFTGKPPKIPARSNPDSWPPGIAELAARRRRDRVGHYAAKTHSRPPRFDASLVREIVDEAGLPVMHLTGWNMSYRACARVTFPDQRWLRFLVRGTERANAIMTAVDHAGNRVARYRIRPRAARQGDNDLIDRQQRGYVEIAVHPDRQLTDELILAIQLSARDLGLPEARLLGGEGYFSRPNV